MELMKAFVAETSCNQFAYFFCVFGMLTIGCARLQQIIPKHLTSMDKCILIASLLKGDLSQSSMTSFYMYDLPTLTMWSQTSLASSLLQTNLVAALGDWTPQQFIVTENVVNLNTFALFQVEGA